MTMTTIGMTLPLPTPSPTQKPQPNNDFLIFNNDDDDNDSDDIEYLNNTRQSLKVDTNAKYALGGQKNVPNILLG